MRLIEWAMALVGRLKGSLGHVSIITNFVMAGVSGSAVADAVATGKPLIPAMRKEGYGEGFAGAVIVAGALLGPILPPSIPMVVYAQISSQSVVKLFMAGVVPAILLAARVPGGLQHRRRYRKLSEPRRGRLEQPKLRATGRASWALMMPVIIIGGIRFGLLTVTESAAVAVLYALFVSFVVYRGITLRQLPKLIFHAGRSTAHRSCSCWRPPDRSAGWWRRARSIRP